MPSPPKKARPNINSRFSDRQCGRSWKVTAWKDKIPLRAVSDTRGQVTCLVGILREWRRNKPVFGYPFRAGPLHLAAVIDVGAKLQAVCAYRIRVARSSGSSSVPVTSYTGKLKHASLASVPNAINGWPELSIRKNTAILIKSN